MPEVLNNFQSQFVFFIQVGKELVPLQSFEDMMFSHRGEMGEGKFNVHMGEDVHPYVLHTGKVSVDRVAKVVVTELIFVPEGV